MDWLWTDLWFLLHQRSNFMHITSFTITTTGLQRSSHLWEEAINKWHLHIHSFQSETFKDSGEYFSAIENYFLFHHLSPIVWGFGFFQRKKHLVQSQSALTLLYFYFYFWADYIWGSYKQRLHLLNANYVPETMWAHIYTWSLVFSPRLWLLCLFH